MGQQHDDNLTVPRCEADRQPGTHRDRGSTGSRGPGPPSHIGHQN